MFNSVISNAPELSASDVRILEVEVQRRLEKWISHCLMNRDAQISMNDRKNQEDAIREEILNSATTLTLPSINRRALNRSSNLNGGESAKASSKKSVMKTLGDKIYAVIRDKKTKFDKGTHEPMMMEFLNCCVELKDTGYAREGFLKYRQLCQHIDPSSLEIVIEYFLDAAQLKVQSACQRCSSICKSLLDGLNDARSSTKFNQTSCLLSIGASMESSERVDQEISLVWLRFAWDCHRTCLDILAKSQKMDTCYYSIVSRSLLFCDKTRRYSKSLEFRRLSELLKDHVDNKLTKASDWGDKLLDLCLTSRIEVMSTAISLGLYPLAFKTIPSIFDVLSTCNHLTPSVPTMSKYYELLGGLFEAEDGLISSYCRLKQWSLSASSNHVANGIILSSLCLVDNDDDGMVVVAGLNGSRRVARRDAIDELYLSSAGFASGSVNRQRCMARLLDLPLSMSADDVRAGCVHHGVLNASSALVCELWHLLLDKDNHHHDWLNKCLTCLDQLKTDAGLLKYVPVVQVAIASRWLTRDGCVSLDEIRSVLTRIGLTNKQVIDLLRHHNIVIVESLGIVRKRQIRTPVEAQAIVVENIFSLDLASVRAEASVISARLAAINLQQMQQRAAIDETVVSSQDGPSDKMSISRQIASIEQGNLKVQQSDMIARMEKLRTEKKHALFAQKAVDHLKEIGREVDVSTMLAMTNEQITAYLSKMKKAVDGEAAANKKIAEERARLFYHQIKLCRMEEGPLIDKKRRNDVERQLTLFNDRKAAAIAKQQADLAKFDKLSRMARFRADYEEVAMARQKSKFQEACARAKEENERNRKMEEDRRAEEDSVSTGSRMQHEDDDDGEVKIESFRVKKKVEAAVDDDNAYRPPARTTASSKAPPNPSRKDKT